jgi:hypothetical protein
VAEVVFAVRVVFYIFPFEVGAAAAVGESVHVLKGEKDGLQGDDSVPTSFFAHRLNEIHDVRIVRRLKNCVVDVTDEV